ncbi:hypothetical protein GOP47_0011211 [Adiantum capillus-veneris]|uniref:Uncharacterized protein n=1 Tax=Adiantum capillus-veneris TaxID=13818 RepID=A0A9D4USD6_ADICA|nr:hypothetical protein GOP47_0011211 [Adiantum capillus-veneris]
MPFLKISIYTITARAYITVCIWRMSLPVLCLQLRFEVSWPNLSHQIETWTGVGEPCAIYSLFAWCTCDFQEPVQLSSLNYAARRELFSMYAAGIPKIRLHLLVCLVMDGNYEPCSVSCDLLIPK